LNYTKVNDKKTPKLEGKYINEPHSLIDKYIELNFSVLTNTAMPVQYSEILFQWLDQIMLSVCQWGRIREQIFTCTVQGYSCTKQERKDWEKTKRQKKAFLKYD